LKIALSRSSSRMILSTTLAAATRRGPRASFTVDRADAAPSRAGALGLLGQSEPCIEAGGAGA
jgi:hypothetical protein